MAPAPDSWISDALNAVFAAVVAGIGFLIRNTWGRIRKLEDSTVRKHEFSELTKTVVHKEHFNDYVDRAENDRKEMRDGIVKLFDKVDEIKTILIAKNTDG